MSKHLWRITIEYTRDGEAREVDYYIFTDDRDLSIAMNGAIDLSGQKNARVRETKYMGVAFYVTAETEAT